MLLVALSLKAEEMSFKMKLIDFSNAVFLGAWAATLFRSCVRRGWT